MSKTSLVQMKLVVAYAGELLNILKAKLLLSVNVLAVR